MLVKGATGRINSNFVIWRLFSDTPLPKQLWWSPYNDVIMSAMASQITSLTIVYSSVCSRADQWKHQSSASLASVWGILRWPVNSQHKGPITRKMFPFDDVIMYWSTMSYSDQYWICHVPGSSLSTNYCPSWCQRPLPLIGFYGITTSDSSRIF